MPANIFCVVCGARPYPELSLPEAVRQDFDLRKGGDGLWRCSQHRKAKAPRVCEPATANGKPLDQLENALGGLRRLVFDLDDEDTSEDAMLLLLANRQTALGLVDHAAGLIEQLKRATKAGKDESKGKGKAA
jgi:hypothetical protein